MADNDSTTLLRCSKCDQVKSLDQFYLETRNGFKGIRTFGRRLPCKQCHRAALKPYAKEYCRREKVKSRKRIAAIGIPRRESNLKQRYKLSLSDYDAILAHQGGGCAICGKTYSVGRNKTITPLCVDHDHETGLIRGLLCSGCNGLLAKLGDNLEGVLRFVAYLKPLSAKMNKNAIVLPR